MHSFPLRTLVSLLLDALLLTCCILRIPDIHSRARAPVDVLQDGDRVVVSYLIDREAAAGLVVGDTIARYGGLDLLSYRNVEFISDHGTIGDPVSVTVMRRGAGKPVTITLIPYFNTLYLVIVMMIGLVTMSIAVFLLINRPRDRTGTVLHWALVGFGACVILAWEGYTPESILGYANSLAFFGTYTVLAVNFLLFTTLFPRPGRGLFGVKTAVITAPALIVVVPMIVHHQAAIRTTSLTEYETYLSWFDAFHVVLIVYALAGILNFIHSFATAAGREERQKLKWILAGLIVGPLPFLLFTVLPMTVAPRYLVPETYTLIFLVAVPLAFAISFIRYHVLDVDLVINRATVYGLVIAALLLVYIVVVGLAADFVGTRTETASIAAAVLVAILFQPVRAEVQRFVDRKFFRVRYNLLEARRRSISEINASLGIRQLAECVMVQIGEIIPAERAAFLLHRESGRQLVAVARMGFQASDRVVVNPGNGGLPASARYPVALGERLESGVRFIPGDPDVFHRLQIVVAFPLPSARGGVHGYVVLGGKKSGGRYTIEDVDLLQAIAVQSGLAIERIELQQDLILEQAEAHRLEDLSRMKSDFVAYVSHELHTPLTSIRMFSELLTPRIGKADRKGKEYLRVIGGESDRLSRMVDSILNSARIEEGIMEYTLRTVDLRDIVDRALDVMHYELDRQGFRVVYRRPRRTLEINADADGVADVIMNLLGNSIKYSASRKHITLTLTKSGGWVTVSVTDRGVGIAAEAIPHLFERFYRGADAAASIRGTGLGLPLVKYVMDVHHGRVTVKSTPGRGSTFVLQFPASDGTTVTAARDDRTHPAHTIRRAP